MSASLDPDTQTPNSNNRSPVRSNRSRSSPEAQIAFRVLSLLLILALLSSFFVIVNAGQRGVLMRFGQVQPQVLNEGLHWIVPIVNTVQLMSVRVQNQEISAEASSKDLQEVYTDVALNWHLIPEEAPFAFQQIGNQQAIVERIINPAVEEVLKAVMAMYTAEEIITRREEVKTKVDDLLKARLMSYHIQIDDISLVHVHFSDRFSDAVEAKQIAEQEAKRAGFMVLKAAREAEAKLELARGEAEAQRLIRETLSMDYIHKQMVERWDGKLPLIVGENRSKVFELEFDELMQARAK
ncbi:MAG: prohibitin family protein [Leptolyngbyaceae cyanobacterium bins.59]|nr:prohibitin family protein [Leptolyngbyaceae cyanobacterium bins.59]